MPNGLPTDPLNQSLLLSLPEPLAKLVGAMRRLGNGRYELPWHGYALRSAFQPIVSFTHNYVIGHEALVRPLNPKGKPVAPPVLLAAAVADGSVVHLDRAIRALHILNFARTPGLLFLNLHPAVFSDPGTAEGTDSFLQFLTELWHVNLRRQVVEFVEETAGTSELLRGIAGLLRRHGLSLALDDFGAGVSNFDRIWDFAPEIVKLDRSIASRCISEPRIRRILPRLVDLLHDSGSQVVLEGIESEAQAEIAVDANVDFGQGWYLTPPMESPVADPLAIEPRLAGIWDIYENEHLHRHHERDCLLAPIVERFEALSKQLASLEGFDHLAAELLALPHAKRAFLVGRDGRVIREPQASCCHGDNEDQCALCTEHLQNHDPIWFGCLTELSFNLTRARVSRRSYFRQAIESPEHVFTSSPYLSYSDHRQTVTLSFCTLLDEKPHVLCVDLDHERLTGESDPESARTLEAETLLDPLKPYLPIEA